MLCRHRKINFASQPSIKITVRRLCKILSTHFRKCENTWKNRKQRFKTNKTVRKKSLKTLITVSYTEKYGAGEQIFIELQNKVEQNQAIECRN